MDIKEEEVLADPYLLWSDRIMLLVSRKSLLDRCDVNKNKALTAAAVLGILLILSAMVGNRLVASPDGECDPSYPDVCIAPPPPDLNCDDVFRR